MRIKLFNMVIILGILVLACYGYSLLIKDVEYGRLLVYTAGFLLLIPSVCIMGIHIDNPVSSTGIKAVSFIFLFLFLISITVFSVATLFSKEAFIVINGILLLMYVLLLKIVYTKGMRNK